MWTRRLAKMIWTAGLVGCVMGGCDCSRDVAAPKGGQIDTPTMAQEKPDAPRPTVLLNPECQQNDPTLNQFILHALEICQNGDYDRFRQLFGTTHAPTSHADFKRVWQDVSDIEVRQVHAGKGEPPPYYLVLAKARLRKPDRKGRQEVNIPLMVFQETGRWRLGPVPKEMREKLSQVASQAASGPTTGAFSP